MNLADLSASVLAVVRGTDPDAALDCVLALAEGGISGIEVSLTTPDALRVIERARRALGDTALLGAGTVLTAADAARAAGAGARFLVTPAVVATGQWDPSARELPVLMGALTPSEITTAMARGALAVKLFPASLGGPAYLRALRDPLPGVPFVPVGGVGLDEARAYLAAGAVTVGVGSPLVGDAARGGDLDALRARIARWRTALTEETALAEETARTEETEHTEETAA
ncbi:bifunctional 4-hydroxy-2-oxoglutarate aldolase/2-dehydro-3-deoxy-phosphogluconate aldolase [Kitasatospora sp. NPDC001527]|uniref:bifunctional 4-hydroxy-2-oxoglutarate aldolase/2-dehydro-3-deoxy-phosphogluconate aldolase n=1 Tax=Kitasatospora sp. NPDC001527 TaxID=3154519 RepID=UPI003316F272